MMSTYPRPPILALFSCIVALALTAWCERVEASIVLEATGSRITTLGIGVGNGQQAGSIGFTTDRRLEDVVFTVPLTHINFGGTSTVNAYLTDSIGPGTTAVDNLLAQNSFPVGESEDRDFEVLTISAIDPGTYHLMLIDFGPNLVGWELIFPPSLTLNSVEGLQFDSSLSYAQESGPFPPAFAPNGDTRNASIFPGVLAFRIEATAIPEPSSIAMFSFAGLVLTLRRGNRRHHQ